MEHLDGAGLRRMFPTLRDERVHMVLHGNDHSFLLCQPCMVSLNPESVRAHMQDEKVAYITRKWWLAIPRSKCWKISYSTFEWLNVLLFEELVPQYSRYGENSIAFTARKDWNLCAENKLVMTYEDFVYSLLTLAENFTISSSHREYFEFLDNLLNKIKSKFDSKAEALALEQGKMIQDKSSSRHTDSGGSDDSASPKHTTQFLIQRRLVPKGLADLSEGASVTDSEPGFDFIHQESDYHAAALIDTHQAIKDARDLLSDLSPTTARKALHATQQRRDGRHRMSRWSCQPALSARIESSPLQVEVKKLENNSKKTRGESSSFEILRNYRKDISSFSPRAMEATETMKRLVGLRLLKDNILISETMNTRKLKKQERDRSISEALATLEVQEVTEPKVDVNPPRSHVLSPLSFVSVKVRSNIVRGVSKPSPRAREEQAPASCREEHVVLEPFVSCSIPPHRSPGRTSMENLKSRRSEPSPRAQLQRSFTPREEGRGRLTRLLMIRPLSAREMDRRTKQMHF